MRRLLLALAAATLAFAGTARAANDGDAGTSAADFLRAGHGAAAIAQGGAFTARGGRVEGLRYNPAGLARLRRPTVMFEHNEYILDVASNYLAAAWRWGDWTVGGDLDFFDYGRFTRRTLSNPGGVGSFEARSWAAGFGVARSFGAHWSVGGILRPFEETIDDASRTGVTADLGLHWTGLEDRLEFGLAARQLGGSVRFDADREQVATEGAFGVSGLFFDRRLRLSLEAARPRHQETDWKAGLEGAVTRSLALRAGYDSRNDAGDGWSVGGGYRYKDLLELDYAYVPFRALGESHRVSLSVFVGGGGESEGEFYAPDPIDPRRDPSVIILVPKRQEIVPKRSRAGAVPIRKR